VPVRTPLYVWRISFHVSAEAIPSEALADLRLSLHQYEARTKLEDDGLTVWMRIVGHEGPASAIGDAAQALGDRAARAGIRAARIEVVHARRISATQSVDASKAPATPARGSLRRARAAAERPLDSASPAVLDTEGRVRWQARRRPRGSDDPYHGAFDRGERGGTPAGV
jgi:hypothetical protein